MKEKDFDHIVKQKLEAINEAPPAYMWDRVAAGLAAQSGPAATSGLSASTKTILVAASVVFILGFAAIFATKDITHKRHAVKHFNKLWKNPQLIRAHKTNEALTWETAGTASADNKANTTPEIGRESHTPKHKQTLNQPLKVAKLAATKAAGTNTSKKQNAMVNNHKDEFPPLPSATEIRKAETISSASANTRQPENKTKTAQNIDAGYTVAAVNNTNQTPNKKEGQADITVTAKTNNPATENKASVTQTTDNKKTVSTAESQKKSDLDSSAIKQVAIITGGLPDDVQKSPEAEETSIHQQDPKNRVLNKYGIGIHYGPEVMDVDAYKLTDQAVDLSFNYQNLNLIVQTGLGVRFSEDQATYDIKYKRWEYWKTQIRFDSASMYIGPNGDTIFQPANTYTEEIYDSLNHSYQATAKQHYTILQIPILAGYQIDFEKFALFIKGGIRYSIVAYQQSDELFIPDEKSRITDYNYPQKSRATSNIDYEFALGGAYKVNKHFQIQLEGFGRYYHYSIYEENPPSGIHPWSLSARAGLVYIF